MVALTTLLPSMAVLIGYVAALAGTPRPHHESSLSASNLITIAPPTANCSGAPFPAECATAFTAAPNIDDSFHHFRISSFGAQAALVSIMLFETGDFKYKINHFPGVPGQGTRNMQSPTFNGIYADWIVAHGKDAAITTTTVAAAKAEGPAALLDLINTDKWGFASAAWFLSTQCEASVAEALVDGQQSSYEAYLTGCVGTTVTDDRINGWKSVIDIRHW